MSLSPPHFIHPTPPSPSPFIPMRPPFPYRGLSFLPSIKPPLRTRTIMTAMSSSPSVPGYALRQRRFAPLNPEKRGESDAPSLGGIVFDVDGTLWYFHYLFYRFIPTWLIKKQFTPTPHVHWNAVCPYVFNVSGDISINYTPPAGFQITRTSQAEWMNWISAALGIDKSIDILHHIRDLPTPEARLEAADKIKAVEREAMRAQQPQPGLVELMNYLQGRGVQRALCTRNFEYVFHSISLLIYYVQYAF